MNKVLQTNPGVTVNTANTNLLIKNLLAEICHFNIPKNTRTCLVKQDQEVLLCGLQLNYDKQFNKGV